MPRGNEAGTGQVIEVSVMPEAVWALAAVAVFSTSHMHTRLVMGVDPVNENKPLSATDVTLESPCSMLGGVNEAMLGQVPDESVQLPSEYWHWVTAES